MIVVVPYLLILCGHVMLPEPAPFALLLALSGAVTVSVSRRLSRTATSRLRAALDGVPSTESMRANLRALEAELHALEDQRRTELAHERHARRHAR